MLTSISTTAISFFNRMLSASLADSGFDEVLPKFGENDLVAEQLGRLVVHHQDVDFRICVHQIYLHAYCDSA